MTAQTTAPAQPAFRPTSPASLPKLKAAKCEEMFRDKLTGATAERPQVRKPAPDTNLRFPPKRFTGTCHEGWNTTIASEVCA
jgi:hypothetical protein